MNFTPTILGIISAWSKEHDICARVSLDFMDGKLSLIYSFTDTELAKVWNKRFEEEYLNRCPDTLYELTLDVLKEAETNLIGGNNQNE
jgi:hypothetical protein